jgi:intracellular multiplication protein IcmL
MTDDKKDETQNTPSAPQEPQKPDMSARPPEGMAKKPLESALPETMAEGPLDSEVGDAQPSMPAGRARQAAGKKKPLRPGVPPKNKKAVSGKANPRSFKKTNSAGSAPKSPVNKGKTESIGNLGAVILRNEFYRDGYRTILKLALLQTVVILGLIGSMFFVIHIHQPENRYFATTEDGRLIPMVPLNEPNLSTPALLSWVAQSATEVMTFGFNDYRRRLQEASRNFTRSGWESFTRALQASRIIEMVEANQQVLTSAPRGAPVLKSEGVVAGRYQWIVQLPMILTYESGTAQRSDRLLVTIVIVRVPRLESPNGVGIHQWVAVPG